MSFKLAEFSLHSSCTGLNMCSGELSNNQHFDRTGGRLFAFDVDGKYMLSCASNGAHIYSVRSLTKPQQYG